MSEKMGLERKQRKNASVIKVFKNCLYISTYAKIIIVNLY